MAIIAAVSLWTGPRNIRAQAQPVDGQSTVEAEIRAAMAEMRKAAERLDAPALYAYVMDTDTPPIIEDGILSMTHAAALERTTQGLSGLSSVSYAYETESITALADGTALWVGSGSATGTLKDGRTIVAPFAETIVFLKVADEWKVLHAHRSAP